MTTGAVRVLTPGACGSMNVTVGAVRSPLAPVTLIVTNPPGEPASLTDSALVAASVSGRVTAATCWLKSDGRTTFFPSTDTHTDERRPPTSGAPLRMSRTKGPTIHGGTTIVRVNSSGAHVVRVSRS